MEINSELLKADFKGRTKQLDIICEPSSKIFLFNLYGEAGIGKTSLLNEARNKIEKQGGGAKAIYIDLYPVSQHLDNRIEETIKLIVKQAEGIISGAWQNLEQVAGLIVNSLNQFNNHTVFMFDTTEALQDDWNFWDWLETHIIGPLVVENHVHLVFAGRIPVPWQHFDVRKVVEIQYLPPLDEDTRDLVIDILTKRKVDFSPAEVEQVYKLIFSFSKGHPLLSEMLANKIASEWPQIPPVEVLCSEIIEPTINQIFFKNIASPWREILWWLSPLDRFDDAFMQFYLKTVAPKLVENQTDYFFGQGLTELNITHSVILKEADSQAIFHGVIGEITRACFKVIRPEDYQRANQAAAETFRLIADKFLKEDEPLFARYNKLADTYQQRNE